MKLQRLKMTPAGEHIKMFRIAKVKVNPIRSNNLPIQANNQLLKALRSTYHPNMMGNEKELRIARQYVE